MKLIDGLLVFRENLAEEWVEMVKISFAILLKNASLGNMELCAIAAAKLHAIIQTRLISDLNEGCYLLYLINKIIVNDLQGKFTA